MKKLTAVCVAAIGLSSWPLAHGDDSTKKPSQSTPSVQVEPNSATVTISKVDEDSSSKTNGAEGTKNTASTDKKFQILTFGNGVKIGADGKIEVLSSNNLDASSKSLPEDVKTIVKELSVQGGKVTVVTSASSASSPKSVEQAKPVIAEKPVTQTKSDSSTQASVKIFVVGPDGKAHETVIHWPEGDEKPLASTFRMNLSPILEAGGVKLSEETLKALESVEQARKQANQVRERAELSRREVEKVAERTLANQDGANHGLAFKITNDSVVNTKLDKILNRLESLEKEVQSLKLQNSK